MRKVKFAEIFIMLAGSYALITLNLDFMLIILFLLGTQSAFFGPLKYSLIPQHLSNEELLAGNAQVGWEPLFLSYWDPYRWLDGDTG